MRLIDADALIMEIVENPPVYNTNRVVDVIKSQPTVGGWISVKDEKPEIGQMCLIWDGKTVKTGVHLLCGVWSVANTLEYPEFWMPLLEPPKEDKDEAD